MAIPGSTRHRLKALLAGLSWLAMMSACASSHAARDDASLDDALVEDAPAPRDTSPDAPVCPPPTSPAELDVFMSELLTAYAANPEPQMSDVSFVVSSFSYARARVLSGEVIMNPALAAECVARAAVMSPWEYFTSDAGEPCVEMFGPRCPAPVGTRCGDNMDCDHDLYCGDRASWLPDCQLSGRCMPRVPLGEPCRDAASCARPDPGFAASGCFSVPGDLEGSFCGNRLFLARGRNALCGVVEWDGEVEVVMTCLAPNVCIDFRCGVLQPEGSVTEGASCGDTSECGPGLWCERPTRRCAPIAAIRCDEPSTDCPPGYACVDGSCAATDGSAGSVCGPPACATGLACHADRRCGELLPLGAPSNSDVDCESQCAAYTSGASVCVPFGVAAEP